MKTLCAYRADGRVTVETAPGTKPFRQWTLTDTEARNLAAQLVAATVGDEHLTAVREGRELAQKGADFLTQLKKIAGR